MDIEWISNGYPMSLQNETVRFEQSRNVRFHGWTGNTRSRGSKAQCKMSGQILDRAFERAIGIEAASEAWEANLKARKRSNWRHFCAFRPFSNGLQLEQRRP